MIKTSEEFQLLSEKLSHEDVSINDIIHALGHKGHPILFLILACPFLIPVPLPGVSVVLGTIIAIFGFDYLRASEIRLPGKLGNLKITSSTLKKILLNAVKWLRRIEPYIHPRHENLIRTNGLLEKFSAFMIIISAVILLLPLPPGTNFPPALVITLLSLGLIEKDLVLIGVGVVAFILKIFFFIAISSYIFKFFEIIANKIGL
jgi:hypothetical protein